MITLKNKNINMDKFISAMKNFTGGKILVLSKLLITFQYKNLIIKTFSGET